MTTVSVGNQAERAAADFLRAEGYEIIELNYRRKYCEIDIVARQDDGISFVEVKYRSTDSFGSGLDYVAADKLRHMHRAAEIWVAEHRYQGEYELAAIEVSGPDFAIGDFIESLY